MNRWIYIVGNAAAGYGTEKYTLALASGHQQWSEEERSLEVTSQPPVIEHSHQHLLAQLHTP